MLPLLVGSITPHDLVLHNGGPFSWPAERKAMIAWVLHDKRLQGFSFPWQSYVMPAPGPWVLQAGWTHPDCVVHGLWIPDEPRLPMSEFERTLEALRVAVRDAASEGIRTLALQVLTQQVSAEVAQNPEAIWRAVQPRVDAAIESALQAVHTPGR